MTENVTKGETHGCIVCGRLYQLYVVYDANGKYLGSRVMSPGGKAVEGHDRPLVACERHTNEEIARAINRVYGKQKEDDE